MNYKAILAGVIVLLVVFSAIFFFLNQQSPIRPRVYIRANGNVEPASTPIKRNGDNYTLTDDIRAEFVVEKSNIAIDGGGHTLHGPYNGTAENLWVIGNGSDQVIGGTQIPYSIGVDLSGGASGLTIANLRIENFSIGAYIWTEGNAFLNNTVSQCVVGVLLSGSGNNITRNNVTVNEVGLFFGTNEPGTVPLNLTVSQNSFVENIRQLGGCLCQESNSSEPIHTWDDGKQGNYWSDYNGTDSNGDGIGDVHYVFDVQNEDRYPLMNSPLQISEAVEQTNVLPVGAEILILVPLALAVAIVVILFGVKHRKKQSMTTRSVN